MKKLLTLSIICLILSINWVQAQATIPGGGTSEADPYRISTVAQLETLRNQVNNGESKIGKVYKIMNNIDLSGIPNWTPIGIHNGPRFAGTLLGEVGIVISNLKINSNSDAQALIASTENTTVIKNITLSNANIKGGLYHACLVGYNRGAVTECAVLNSESSGSGMGALLVGMSEGIGNISKCYVSGIVTSTERGIGGICGSNQGQGITNCFADVVLNGSSHSTLGNVGGIVGYQIEGTPAVTYCYSKGKINSGAANIGGICGGLSATQKISRCLSLMSSLHKGSRICGIGNFQIDNCYANDMMRINGVVVSSTNPSSNDGANVALYQVPTQYFWESIGYDFTTIWEMSKSDSEFQGYPILQWMKYDPFNILGSGTMAEPYKIENVGQLERLRDEVNSGDFKTGKFYELGATLDLKYIPNWIPIGTYPTYFNGTFKGNGNSIMNLTITGDENNKALFGLTGSNALITGVQMENVKISGKHGLACLVANNYGIVSECEVSGEISGMGNTGLIVGLNWASGVITKCFAKGTLTSTSTSLGGICGINDGRLGSTTISNCYTDVVMNGGDYTGGILGYDYGTNSTIENCYSKGKVQGTGMVGGIVGRILGPAKVRNCVSLMSSAVCSGYLPHRIVGYIASAQIENCYATQDMTVNNNMISSIDANSMDGANISRSGVIQNVPFWGSTAKFNLSNIWILDDFTNYPVLKNGKNISSRSLVRTQSNEQNTEIEPLQATTTTPRLDQNAPNPFSSNTGIGYYIPETAKQADLYIYNLLGAQVKGSTITTRGQGEYTINNSELTVGTYIYKLVVDGQIIGTKKMMLAK